MEIVRHRSGDTWGCCILKCEPAKIYSDDAVCPYKTTKIRAIQTKAEIDGLLARWGVRDVMWHWDPEHNDVSLRFALDETWEGKPIHCLVKVEPPRIWNHKTRKRVEEINWPVSMRVMFWFMKSHLEMAYLTSSQKTVAFLPHIVSRDGTTKLKDVVVPRLDALNQLTALPTYHDQEAQDRKPVDVTVNDQ